jgi:hypothetical protein
MDDSQDAQHDQPPGLFDAPAHAPERRESPGRRVGDYERTIERGAIDLVKKARRGYLIVASVAAAVSSALTVLLLLFGLRIGGAADLSDLRKSTLHADSVLEQRVTVHDSTIATDHRAIEGLQQQDEIKMILLCVIADRVGASTGGRCNSFRLHP